MSNMDAFKKLTKLKENLQDLTREEAYEIFKGTLKGSFSPVKSAVFLTAMRIKGETTEELLGVMSAVEEGMNFPPPRPNALDLAMNYDGKNRTLYILPSALWICSQLGMEFTNHFALRTPTKEGITLYEVVEAMGVDVGVHFSDQKDYAPELAGLMPLRRELGFRSLINTIEKFLNPFKTERVVVSLFHKPYFGKNADLLDQIGVKDYTLVKGVEGGIEPLTDRPTLIMRKGKELESIDPKDLGLDLPKDIKTDRVLEDSVAINRKVISGEERGEFLSWAIYTAGVLLYAFGKYKNVTSAIEEIRKATKL